MLFGSIVAGWWGWEGEGVVKKGWDEKRREGKGREEKRREGRGMVSVGKVALRCLRSMWFL